MQDLNLHNGGCLNFLFKLNNDKVYPDFTKESKFDEIYSRMQIADIDKEEGRVLASLDVDNVENLFKKDYFYISPKSDGPLNERFKRYLSTGKNIDVPTIVLTEDDDGVLLNFIDGRHRFSVLRDMGMSHMPFALDDESERIAKKHGIMHKQAAG